MSYGELNTRCSAIESSTTPRLDARCPGIAFQIKDDLLETDGADNSDEINNKSTYITLFGKERAAELAEKYTATAIGELDGFGEQSAELKDIAFALLGRTK